MSSYQRAGALFGAIFVLVWISNLYAAEGLLDKGIAEFNAENYEEALPVLSAAYQADPKDPRVTYYLGMTYRETLDFVEALKFLRQTLDLDPGMEDIWIAFADTLYRTGNYKEGLSAAEAALTAGKRLSECYYIKGLISVKLNRHEEAIDAFLKAKELDNSLTQQTDFQIAGVYFQDRAYEDARAIFERVITMGPGSEWALWSKEYLAYLETMPRPYTLNVSLGLQYDDNVLAIPLDQNLVDVSKQSDWKKIYTLLGGYTFYGNQAWDFNGSYYFSMGQYHEHDYPTNTPGQTVFSPDSAEHTLSLAPTHRSERSTQSLLLSYSYLEVDHLRYMQVFSLGPICTFVMTDNHLAEFYLRYRRREHDFEFVKREYGAYQSSEEDRDADNYAAGIGYSHTYSEGNGIFGLRAEGELNNADGINWNYKGITGSSWLIHQLIPDRLKASLFLQVSHQDYTDVNSIYQEKRRDTVLTTQAVLACNITKHLEISLGYTHTASHSNISVYDYRQNLYTISAGFIL